MEGHGKTGLLVGFAGYLLQRQDGSKDLDGGGKVQQPRTWTARMMVRAKQQGCGLCGLGIFFFFFSLFYFSFWFLHGLGKREEHGRGYTNSGLKARRCWCDPMGWLN
jgi:hypothetical protein